MPIVPLLAQSDSINNTDEKGWKQGRWVIKSDGVENNDCFTGVKVEEGTFKDNRKAGTWRKWWCNGKLKNELIYNSDKTISSKDYFASGQLKEEGTWNTLGWIGPYKFYYENGQLFYEWVYDQSGKRTGRQRYFYENGNPMFDGEWNGGKEAGVIKEYYEDGSLRVERSFNDGKLDTLSVKKYAPSVKVVEKIKEIEPKIEIPIVKEELGQLSNGFHKTYKNGKLDKEGEFANGKMIDGKQFYYKDDKLVKTIIYKEGKIQQTIVEK